MISELLSYFEYTLSKMSHATDLSLAWSKQVPQDVPRNPNLVNGGVRIAYRERFGSAVLRNNVQHQKPIQQKRDQDDMEQLRQLLSGLMKRPDSKLPNAGHRAQMMALQPGVPPPGTR